MTQDELSADVAAFLAKGGKIQRVDSTANRGAQERFKTDKAGRPRTIGGKQQPMRLGRGE